MNMQADSCTTRRRTPTSATSQSYGRRCALRYHEECRDRGTNKFDDSLSASPSRNAANTQEICWKESLLSHHRSAVRPISPKHAVPAASLPLRMYGVQTLERQESWHSTLILHERVPPHPESIDIGQHRTQFSVDVHYVLKLRLSLPENLSCVKNCLFCLQTAISCQIEGLTGQPCSHGAMRRIHALTYARARRISLQVQVKPRILLGIEPSFGGCKHQR